MLLYILTRVLTAALLLKMDLTPQGYVLFSFGGRLASTINGEFVSRDIGSANLVCGSITKF